ncbi:uncharacterized protein VDAG_00305 [Verticillium dahliae VdLs.17]|uniref:Uncharacterized protein n=1 Tax=Verticillium dahliae (strain VdLs.17 / ATCC MYA-4575 / FGSC 10137) TaxID=498257 RepID=G2WRX2_VERDV|nr:uncharacterized protein VDAG_00305 [Verticillium dahliae VdLs.17]EGY13623.1 hypothetical protein VDAG_00305 [Verticillium dahliae VdLs.17]
MPFLTHSPGACAIVHALAKPSTASGSRLTETKPQHDARSPPSGLLPSSLKRCGVEAARHRWHSELSPCHTLAEPAPLRSASASDWPPPCSTTIGIQDDAGIPIIVSSRRLGSCATAAEDRLHAARGHDAILAGRQLGNTDLGTECVPHGLSESFQAVLATLLASRGRSIDTGPMNVFQQQTGWKDDSTQDEPINDLTDLCDHLHPPREASSLGSTRFTAFILRLRVEAAPVTHVYLPTSLFWDPSVRKVVQNEPHKAQPR